MRMIDAPTPPSSIARPFIFGVIAVIFGFFGFILWSILTPLDSAVVAEGVVKVGSEKKQIQHFEGGIIKELLVNEGDHVEKGQTLVLLDETFADADHQMLFQQKQEMLIREALLTSQRDTESHLIVPEVIQNHLEDSSWLASQVESAEKLFSISKEFLDGKLLVLDSQISQLQKKSLGDKKELAAKNNQISFLEEEIASWEKLIERKFANKLRYLEVQGQLAELEGERASLHTQITSAESKIEELVLEKDQVSQQYREQAANELVEVQSKIKDLKERIASASNILGRVEIKSPVAGKVVGLKLYTLGGVVKSGETIMEVVPDKDELVVGAKIRPIDIDKVYQNMLARIRFSSYKQHELPEFTGEILSVSADVFENPNTLESYYTARIKISDQSFLNLSEGKVHPGMPAEVLIVTGESSPAQYLIEPLLAAFRTAWRDT